MKKTFSQLFLLLVFLCVVPQAFGQSVEGNGKLKSENRSVADFTALTVTGGFEVVLTQGAAESLKLEADENILPYIESSVENGVLSLKMKSGIRNAKHLKAYVTVRDLKRLNLSGGIKLASTNAITGNSLKLDLAGGIHLELDMQVKELTADAAGGTKIILTGRADRVRMDLAGATNLQALGLKTEHFTLDAAGASSAQVNVSKELQVEAAGIVNVEYKGSPTIKHSGMGKVRPI